MFYKMMAVGTAAFSGLGVVIYFSLHNPLYLGGSVFFGLLSIQYSFLILGEELSKKR